MIWVLGWNKILYSLWLMVSTTNTKIVTNLRCSFRCWALLGTLMDITMPKAVSSLKPWLVIIEFAMCALLQNTCLLDCCRGRLLDQTPQISTLIKYYEMLYDNDNRVPTFIALLSAVYCQQLIANLSKEGIINKLTLFAINRLLQITQYLMLNWLSKTPYIANCVSIIQILAKKDHTGPCCKVSVTEALHW